MLDKIVGLLQGMVLLMMCIQDIRKTSEIKKIWRNFGALAQMVKRVNLEEQRCGTCSERFTCPAWPGVCYPCPHYNDQDGILDARWRKEQAEEEAYLACAEAIREEVEDYGKEE